jgi:hypothetical protein
MSMSELRHHVVMALRVVVLAAAVSLAVTAGSLLAASVATADIDFECTPGCWGAVAASPSTGQEVSRLNHRTRQKAEDDAVLWCDVLGKTNDCELVASGLGCLSLASSSDGKTFTGGVAFTQDAADAAALDAAPPGSTVDLRDCNS